MKLYSDMKACLQRKVWLFFTILVLFLIQDKLQDWCTPFKYFDEAFGLVVVPVALWRLTRLRRLPKLSKSGLWLGILLIVFFLSGWAGHFVYRYQPLKNALMDSYVNIKFFLALAAAWLLFDDGRTDWGQLKEALWPVLNVITVELFLLCIANLAFDVFEYDMRGPLRAIKLFYSAYTVLVGLCALLCAIYLWYYGTKGKKVVPYLLMLCAIMYFTRRVKGFGAIAVVFVVYLLVLVGDTRLSRRMKTIAYIVVGVAGVAGLYQMFSYYFAMGIESARAMLTLASPFCAWDHFPTGSGWATFGSAFSGEPYSPVYGQYLLRGIWGLGPGDDPSFLSDTYWPMILGQCGFFGFAAFVAALVLFVRKLLKLLEPDRSAYASAVFVLMYLLISSTSESALANPIATPLAFWLGFMVAQRRQETV